MSRMLLLDWHASKPKPLRRTIFCLSLAFCPTQQLPPITGAESQSSPVCLQQVASVWIQPESAGCEHREKSAVRHGAHYGEAVEGIEELWARYIWQKQCFASNCASNPTSASWLTIGSATCLKRFPTFSYLLWLRKSCGQRG